MYLPIDWKVCMIKISVFDKSITAQIRGTKYEPKWRKSRVLRFLELNWELKALRFGINLT